MSELPTPSPASDAPKAQGMYLPELDGLRFFAFLLVFIHHHNFFATLPIFSVLHRIGWGGVDLFFALSAFLFTKLLLLEFQKTSTINFRKFYIRRIFRIWPIYYLFVAASVFIFIHFKGVITDEIVIRILGLLTFTDNIMSALYTYSILPYITHMWTISYEEQFYLAIPVTILILARTRPKNRALAFWSTFLIFNLIRIGMIAGHAIHPAIWVLPVSHFESMLFGIVIGFGGFDFLSNWLKPGVWFGLGLVLFGLNYLLPPLDAHTWWLVPSYLLVGISTSLMLFALLQSEGLKRFFAQPLFIYLGKRSYGLYVYHIIANGFSSYLLLKFPFLPSGLFFSCLYSFAITLVTGILSYRLIETPFLRWKHKFEVIRSRPV